ncbi:hypothetical protein GALL_457950 [mine drainage metagenome]|uniref:Uncharacterized protein n=1 Tax=mine drainage metagenome TaxID=410659 RepID=A0A1J5PN62_9ZZZZ
MEGAASAAVLSEASPDIVTSWRAPLDPSIMVTVLCSDDPVLLADLATGSEPLAGAMAGFSSAGPSGRIAMRVIGSPPCGLSLKRAKPAKAARNSPNRTATACIPVNGSRSRRFRRTVSCPSGALRSSAVSAIELPESAGPTIPRQGKTTADAALWPCAKPASAGRRRLNRSARYLIASAAGPQGSHQLFCGVFSTRPGVSRRIKARAKNASLENLQIKRRPKGRLFERNEGSRISWLPCWKACRSPPCRRWQARWR